MPSPTPPREPKCAACNKPYSRHPTLTNYTVGALLKAAQVLRCGGCFSREDLIAAGLPTRRTK
jgi:hypothetical protein